MSFISIFSEMIKQVLTTHRVPLRSCVRPHHIGSSFNPKQPLALKLEGHYKNESTISKQQKRQTNALVSASIGTKYVMHPRTYNLSLVPITPPSILRNQHQSLSLPAPLSPLQWHIINCSTHRRNHPKRPS